MDFYNSRFALLFMRKGHKSWAITLGPVTFYSVPEYQVSTIWRKHEDCHKRQWRRYWYIGFAVLYLYYMARYGYQNNPFEIEALKAES
jgi:hypothetical protein